LMALGDVEVVETGLAIVQQAATGFGKVPLIAIHSQLAAPFSLRHRGRIPHISH
jgi:hypothetical protein